MGIPVKSEKDKKKKVTLHSPYQEDTESADDDAPCDDTICYRDGSEATECWNNKNY